MITLTKLRNTQYKNNFYYIADSSQDNHLIPHSFVAHAEEAVANLKLLPVFSKKFISAQ